MPKRFFLPQQGHCDALPGYNVGECHCCELLRCSLRPLRHVPRWTVEGLVQGKLTGDLRGLPCEHVRWRRRLHHALHPLPLGQHLKKRVCLPRELLVPSKLRLPGLPGVRQWRCLLLRRLPALCCGLLLPRQRDPGTVQRGLVGQSDGAGHTSDRVPLRVRHVRSRLVEGRVQWILPGRVPALPGQYVWGRSWIHHPVYSMPRRQRITGGVEFGLRVPVRRERPVLQLKLHELPVQHGCGEPEVRVPAGLLRLLPRWVLAVPGQQRLCGQHYIAGGVCVQGELPLAPLPSLPAGILQVSGFLPALRGRFLLSGRYKSTPLPLRVLGHSLGAGRKFHGVPEPLRHLPDGPVEVSVPGGAGGLVRPVRIQHVRGRPRRHIGMHAVSHLQHLWHVLRRVDGLRLHGGEGPVRRAVRGMHGPHDLCGWRVRVQRRLLRCLSLRLLSVPSEQRLDYQHHIAEWLHLQAWLRLPPVWCV